MGYKKVSDHIFRVDSRIKSGQLKENWRKIATLNKEEPSISLKLNYTFLETIWFFFACKKKSRNKKIYVELGSAEESNIEVKSFIKMIFD